MWNDQCTPSRWLHGPWLLLERGPWKACLDSHTNPCGRHGVVRFPCTFLGGGLGLKVWFLPMLFPWLWPINKLPKTLQRLVEIFLIHTHTHCMLWSLKKSRKNTLFEVQTCCALKLKKNFTLRVIFLAWVDYIRSLANSIQ